jgi:hypothetical protein
MKIEEFHKKDNFELPFNLAEDLYTFMKNDAMFYRKHYFPALARCSDMSKANKDFNLVSEMMPVIDRAYKVYKSMYGLPDKTDNIFKDEDRQQVCSLISDEEMETIKQGGY